MRILTATAIIPKAAQNSPAGKLGIDLMRRAHDRDLRDAAIPQVLVQHQPPQAQIVGDDSIMRSHAYLLDPDDMQHLAALRTACAGGDAQQILTAAHALTSHLDGDQAPQGEPS